MLNVVFGSSTARNKQVLLGVLALGVFVVCLLWVAPGSSDGPRGTSRIKYRYDEDGRACGRYPVQQIYHKYAPGTTQYKITIVADKDKRSKIDAANGGGWHSALREGSLVRDPTTGRYSITWSVAGDQPVISHLNEAGRAMELSELAYFNGQLLTFDDRTGLVFSVEGNKVIPQHILMEGNGHTDKGMKIEWATVKDSVLYVGSTGKEWTTPQGEFINNNPQWVKTIDTEGRINHIDWGQQYTALRKLTDTLYPGYLLHEAVRWNAASRRWFFLPRRVSKEAYDDELDEERGSNTIISTDEFFSDIRVTHIGEHIPTHGFSSFQFVPYREHEIVALKSEEHKDKIATYITVFDLNGKVLMEETLIGNVKYEGLEFI